MITFLFWIKISPQVCQKHFRVQSSDKLGCVTDVGTATNLNAVKISSANLKEW